MTGRFVAASPEALALQAEAAALVARTEASQAQIRNGDPLPFRDLRSAALGRRGLRRRAAARAPRPARCR